MSFRTVFLCLLKVGFERDKTEARGTVQTL